MKFYTSQEIADVVGVNLSTIYNWEKRGIITPIKVTPTRRRFYSEEQMIAMRNNDFDNEILKGKKPSEYQNGVGD